MKLSLCHSLLRSVILFSNKSCHIIDTITIRKDLNDVRQLTKSRNIDKSEN